MTTATRMRQILTGAQPDQFAGLALWLKADALALADNDPVTTWTDASGHALHATSSGGARPTYKTNILNGRPVARFDGNDSMATAATGPTAQPTTYLTVVKLASVTAGENIFDGVDFTNRQAVYLNTGPTRWVVWAGSDGPVGNTDTSPHVLSAVFDGAASTLHIDGTAAGTGNVNTGQFGGVTLGAAPFGGASFLSGDLAELIVYTRALSTWERRSLERYLGVKYGLAVA